MTEALTPELLQLLRSVDTPTVCNAIEVAQGQRGFDAFTRGTMVATGPRATAIAGYARTATIRGSLPSDDPPGVVRTRRLDYFRHMAEGPRPTVAVIEDLDHPDCIGAWWGEVHATVHKGLGLAGALTNGLVRDLGDLPEAFPIIAGGVGVSHGFVHVMEIGTLVEINGLPVQNGDFVHADQHGALVIPPDVLPMLAAAIKTLHESEQLILGPASRDGFDLEALIDAWTRFEKART